MIQYLGNRLLDQFERRYDYDVTYMREMLRNAPRAFFNLLFIMKAAQYHERVPADAHFAAKLVGALAEDCGPCTQLVVNMARQARIPDAQIAAVLCADHAAMSADVGLAVQFAQAVSQRSPNEADARAAIWDRWGDKGVIDLTFALQVGRMFPMLKAGMGHGQECRRINVGTQQVEVFRHPVNAAS